MPGTPAAERRYSVIPCTPALTVGPPEVAHRETGDSECSPEGTEANRAPWEAGPAVPGGGPRDPGDASRALDRYCPGARECPGAACEPPPAAVRGRDRPDLRPSLSSRCPPDAQDRSATSRSATHHSGRRLTA